MVDQKPQYLTTKRGVFYYTRRIPQSLQVRFQSYRFVKCLHTKSQAKAHRLSLELSSRLENIWDRMRLEVLDFRTSRTRTSALGSSSVGGRDFRLSDGFELYLRLKAATKPTGFTTYTERNQRYLIECLGDIQMMELSPIHGANFRDHLLQKELSPASVRRVFSTVKAVVNLCISERGLVVVNPFVGVYIPSVETERKRKPIPSEAIRKIQTECRSANDDQRLLIALISDSGMRLSEACGLLVEDFKLGGNIPYLDLKPHPWRRLKTKGSSRQIPLVGVSLWAARRVVSSSQSPFAFPRYCSVQAVKANSASGALNKWLNKRVPTGCVVHSFRHSFRDRLRAVQCPTEVIDALGGWRTAGVGNLYGDGFQLDQKWNWIKQLE